MPLLVGLREAAAQLGPVSVTTLRRLVKAGDIQHVRVRGRILVPEVELSAFVSRSATSVFQPLRRVGSGGPLSE